MRLTDLSVRDIASYSEAYIDFRALEYPVFISGPTGTGKTTLFVDAITAALYGECYGVGRRLREIIAMDRKRGRIELSFSIQNSHYKVTRVIWKDRTEETYLKKIVGGGERSYLEGPRNVNRMLLNLIGFDYTGLLNSCIIRQGEVYRFILAKPYERRNILVELFKLGLEEYRRRVQSKIEALDREISEIRNKRIELSVIISEKERVSAELEALEQRKRELEERQRAIDNEIERIKEKIELTRAKIQALSKEVGAYEEVMGNKERWEMELEGKEKEIEELHHELKNVGVDVEKSRDILSSGARIYELEDLRKRLDDLEDSIRIIRILEVKPELDMRYDELSHMLESIKSTITREKQRIEMFKDSLNRIIKAGDKCPICNRPLTDEHKSELIEEYDSEISEARRKIKGLTAEHKTLAEEFDEISEKLRELDVEKARLDEKLNKFGLKYDRRDSLMMCNRIKEEYIKRYQDALIHLRGVFDTGDIGAMKSIYNLYDRYGSKIDRYAKLREELDSLKKKILEAQKKIMRIEDKISELNIENQKHDDLNKELNRKSDERNMVTGYLGNVSGKINMLKSRYDRILENEVEAKRLDERAAILEIDGSALRILDETFSERGIPTFLLNRYLEQLEDYSNMYLEEFGLPLSLEFRLSYEKDRQKVDMIAYRRGVADDIVTFSGGETALLGFAVRLAMNRLVSEVLYGGNKPRFMIIDEGFGAMDTELRKKVVYALESLMDLGEYEQIMIISHQEDLMDEPIFRSVVRVTKVDEVSRLEVIYRD